MIKETFNYLGKDVQLTAYNNGGLKVVNQFLQDYIFEPFESMTNGKELKFLHRLYNNGKDCMNICGLDVSKKRKYTYVTIWLDYGDTWIEYDNFHNEINLKFNK